MRFIGNLMVFASMKEFCKSTRIDKVIAMVIGWHPSLTHRVEASLP